MLTLTATAVGGAYDVDLGPRTKTVFDDNPNNQTLDAAAVVATGSGVGNLQSSALGGHAAWLLTAIFGAALVVGFSIDFNGKPHDAPFTYVAKAQTVKIDGKVYSGLAIDTTTTVPQGSMAYVQDNAYGVWMEQADGGASL